MATTVLDPVDGSYEEFVRLHAAELSAYLRGVLGSQVEGRGGRVGVDDALQEALLRIYAEWPELREVRDLKRDRRLYRCLRDAAGQALRSEYGRREDSLERPRVMAFDFAALREGDDELPVHERELTAAVLGAMARDLVTGHGDADRRAMLDRAILVAGLRALSEREAVILIAVDHLGWDQQRLAERLEIGFSALRQTLFGARKLFYALVRHAAGIEVDEQERARLVAYLAGELSGAEKREARRHLKHCKPCQALEREQRVFGRDAFGLLAPLPFIFGAKALVKRSGVKGAALGGTGAGSGLLGQAGAAKALAVVVGFLGIGVGGTGWLAERDEQPARHDRITPAVGIATPAPAGMRRTALPASSTTTHKNTKKKKKKTAQRHRRSSSPRSTTTTPPASTSNNGSSAPAASTGAGQASSATSSPGTGSGGAEGEFFGGP